MSGVDENTAGSFLQAPAVRLRRTKKVTPIGVGILAAGQPDIGDAFIPVE